MEAVKPEVVVVETLGSHGRVQARDRIVLTGEKRHVTIGRGAEADVIVDDAYAAALHAAIEVAPDGTILASDLGSENGIGVAGRRHKDARQLPVPGGLLQIGRTHLRVRSTREALAPERPDHAAIAPEQGSPSWAAGGGALACAAYVAYSAWLEAPRDLATTIVVAFIPALIGAGGWIALWALLARVMLGEWRWLWHAAILFSVVAVYVLTEGLLDVAWFAYALPHWESRDVLMAAVAFAVALYWHLTHASGISRRRAALIAALLPATVAFATIWTQVRVQERDVNHIGVREKVYPPALRAREGGEARSFFERAAQLKAAADLKRSRIPADDVSDSGIWSD
jgi:hypothetical protein